MGTELKIIARIRTDFPTKFGIPRQSGLVESLKGMIVFEPEFRNPDVVRAGRVFSYLAYLAVFGEPARKLVGDGATATTGWQYKNRCFCLAVAISPQPFRIVFGPTHRN